MSKIGLTAEQVLDRDQHVESPVLCLAVLPKDGFEDRAPVIQFPLYWLIGHGFDGHKLNSSIISRLEQVLIDPLQEQLLYCFSADRRSWVKEWHDKGFSFWAERQFLPGVTDNLAKTIEEALLLCGLPEDTRVASGNGFLFSDRTQSAEAVIQFCQYKLFHPLTDRFVVHELNKIDGSGPALLSFPSVTLPEPKPVEEISLDLSDEELERLSKQRVLALTNAELKAVRDHFVNSATVESRKQQNLPKWPTDVELEVIAQTWSEHCKHKIFNANIAHTDLTNSDKPEKTSISSLYKTYIQAATFALKPKRKDLLSVFEDNAGVVRWNDKWAVCFKVETHNSPSALEPYGGALTGILGVNRDVLGTGLGAKPLFNTDVFCFAYPSNDLPFRPTMLPPEAIISGVRKGVEDGGNKSGIPTVNGAVYFHPGYRAKPLVYCGTGGILPLDVNGLCGYEKHTACGDTIVMAGGRVGKDGIHGATFSSESLHEGSPMSAVQIGDPFTQKRLLDFIIEARDLGLISGITDNGAGGLSSSIGEMAQITGGATLELDNIPLKYPGLADWEIVVSESQERMTISTRRFAELAEVAKKHRVEVTAVGTFNDKGVFEITRHGKPVAILNLNFLHKGAPKLNLESEWRKTEIKDNLGVVPADLGQELIALLSHPNICSRESIIRQYDHEVQGQSVIKPLMGVRQQAPCDAAVIKPLYEEAALVISNGLCPQYSELDAYLMAVCAVDEAVRNAVCVGADPESLSILDNFCWPDPVESKANPEGKKKLAQLVRSCQGLYDASIAFTAPLISGKDSMKNDFDDGVVRLSIPPTLLISAMGRLPIAEKAISMEFKSKGDLIYLISSGTTSLSASQYAISKGWTSSNLPTLDLVNAKLLYKKLHEQIKSGHVKSCHDLSEGGLAVALAECVIGSGLGADVSINESTRRLDEILFAEGPGQIIVTIDLSDKETWENIWRDMTCVQLGAVSDHGKLCVTDSQGKQVLVLTEAEMCKAWKTALPIE